MDNEIVKLLTDDIRNHREHVQKLYARALAVGAGALVIALAILYYVTGNRLETELVNQVLQKQVQQQVGALAREEAELALRDATAKFRELIEREIGDQASEAVDKRLSEIDDAEVQAQIRAAVLPRGAVVPFNGEVCPEGWLAYRPAQGRFIRGIDLDGRTDPDGRREPGNVQMDQFKRHDHSGTYFAHYHAGNGGPDHPSPEIPRGSEHANEAWSVNPEGGSETRPINVALLFCEKT